MLARQWLIATNMVLNSSFRMDINISKSLTGRGLSEPFQTHWNRVCSALKPISTVHCSPCWRESGTGESSRISLLLHSFCGSAVFILLLMPRIAAIAAAMGSRGKKGPHQDCRSSCRPCTPYEIFNPTEYIRAHH